MVSASLLSPIDYIEYIQHEYLIDSSSMIKLQFRDLITNISITDDSAIPFDGMTLFNKYYSSSSVKSDYSNVTIKLNQSTIGNTIVSFSFSP